VLRRKSLQRKAEIRRATEIKVSQRWTTLLKRGGVLNDNTKDNHIHTLKITGPWPEEEDKEENI
jgi:hypothetical protein